MEQPQKIRDLRRYETAWEDKVSWVKGVDDPHKAFCTVCCREITIGYGGFRDIIRHEKAAKHINAISKGASNFGTFSVTCTANNIDADCTVKYGNGQDLRADKKMHLSRTREQPTSKNVSGESTVGKIVSDPPTDLASSLRMWVPPLRLLSASIWQVVQQRQVQSYNRVEEFVSVVLELVPDLLSTGEKIVLLLGLRAKFAIDSCHHQPARTFQMMSSQLERVLRISDIASSDGDMRQTVDAAVKNLKELIQSLADSPEYSRQYFQDIYPFHYGPSYDAALQLLVWEFLSRLEMLLPVPSFHQVVSLFDEDPLLLEEFLQVGDDPQPIQEFLLHNKHFTRLLSGQFIA
ncbi:uncharacterized protein LOC134447254 [Engraulis encrasicolus]|uniref:uncharacterized protein LOC134447254 n=1 Tax=Engraulis encrasicolus TaxID=184585 RepID=UPI002FD4BCB1